MIQNALTVLVPIRRAEGGATPPALVELLAAVGDDVMGNPHLRLADSPSTHFARFVLLDRDPKYPPRLLFSSNHDGDLPGYAAELAANLGAGLDRIFGFCEGYAPGSAVDGGGLLAFLRSHSLRPAAFYAAYQGSGAAEIRAAAATRARLAAELDGPGRDATLAALTPLMPGGPAPPAVRPNAVAAAAGKALGAAAEWLAGIRAAPPDRHRRKSADFDLVRIEDLQIQNQMTVVSAVKPGWWPRLFVRVAFLLVSAQARRARGSLSGLTTIHFARWVVLDGGERLLFESNYDGSWENYIDDFVDFASVGMNVIWGTAVDFPRGGARDIEAFKQIIRHYQIPTQVFYSADPSATVTNILNDLRLARAVASGRPDEGVRRLVTGSYGAAD